MVACSLIDAENARGAKPPVIFGAPDWSLVDTSGDAGCTHEHPICNPTTGACFDD